MRIQVLFSFLFISTFLFAQSDDQLYRLPLFDVQHYSFALNLSDQTDQIMGVATIQLVALKELDRIPLDLFAVDEDGKGMQVDSIIFLGSQLSYLHKEELLLIELRAAVKASSELAIRIHYHGMPKDGLIIEENKYGDRTFFGDNWPNRARQWLPCVDHPSDKATVEFIVEAPERYQVVATGLQIEESNLLGTQTKRTHYYCSQQMPTKVMVIGVAEFATQLAGHVGSIQVTSWVYPQNREDGFREYFPAVDILQFFVDLMGSYPNQKLANVQSKTRYGGMENAGNIFYYEGSVNGQLDDANLLAHEIAHQWFGNSASELDWHHVWLSEGFATYLTNIFIENTQGLDTMRSEMVKQRNQIIAYYKKIPAPIIDTSISDYKKVLSANSYQKGAWFLHMLRQKMGDEKFFAGIKAYYNQYAYSNALSSDLQRVLEVASGENLDNEFQQWLYQKGQPEISVAWDQSKKRKVAIQLNQHQTSNYTFPITIQAVGCNGESYQQEFFIDEKNSVLSMKVKSKICDIKLDPDTQLLFEQVSP